MPAKFIASKGDVQPYGASFQKEGVNFAIFSKFATQVTLCLFDRNTGELLEEFELSPEENKSGDVWHIFIHDLPPNIAYAYRMDGPKAEDKSQIYDKNDLLLDPYAKALATSTHWGKVTSFPALKNTSYLPLGDIVAPLPFDWGNDRRPLIPPKDLIIYEMHVRGFTIHSSSQVKNPGSFLGVIEKIPHLLKLGVNAVELLPIHEFDETEYARMHPGTKRNLYNYWGYSTVNFFAPTNRYAVGQNPGDVITEFKTMVRELHRHGIEVILDVVYNHTAEGDERGPTFSFKGIDNSIYYMLDPTFKYLNFSGCGNTFSGNNPIVRDLIINSLRYWVTEMHVDGFRFDLASALTRNFDGTPLSDPPLIDTISQDPVLADCKLFAEPWDAGGLYQVGSFYPQVVRWMEWNGKYRDTIRRYCKSTQSMSGEFAMRLCGSEDLYHNRSPYSSTNFVTVHDGFTLADLVSYDSKHNIDNGEGNRDGESQNESWNCGIEGPTTNKKILYLRGKQMRNMHLALMISQGIPLLLMGDEYGHTKNGNNNTWCHDSDVNWFLWDKLENSDFFRFYTMMISFRKANPILRRKTFLTAKDVDWHGIEPFKPDWSSDNLFVAFTLKDHKNNQDLYIAFNMYDRTLGVQIPPPPYAKKWYWIVNTANDSPNDIYEENHEHPLDESSYRIPPHSAILLKAL